jgi:hypothetical protein
MQIDDQRIPTNQIAWLWLVGLIGAAVLPSLRLSPADGATSADAIARAWRGIVHGLTGFFAGAAVGFPLALCAWFVRRDAARNAAACAIVVATASVGLFLGAEAMVIVTALAIALRAVSLCLGLVFSPLRHTPLTMEIFVAALVYICVAERLVFVFAASR